MISLSVSESCFGWNHTKRIQKLSECVLWFTTYIFVFCLFYLIFLFCLISWTRLAEVVTWKLWNACPTLQRCSGAGVSEWTPARVLTNFENRSGAGIDFFKEGPEWSRSRFLNMRLVCILLQVVFFAKYIIMSISNVKNYFIGSPTVFIHLGCE